MDYSKFTPKHMTGKSVETQVQQDSQAPQDPVSDIAYSVKAIKNTAIQVDEANIKMATQFDKDTSSHCFNKPM